MKSDFFHSNVPVIPGSRFFLVRPRLDHILEQALESGLTTVTAGPGYGKTQAVSSYLSRTNAVVLWLQVSEQDNLGARFWENLTEVTCSYNYSVGKALQDIGFPVSVRQFDRFRDILSRTMKPDRRYILVFDDCHLLRPGPVLELIERSVVTPPFLHSLVMISRSEPEINTVSLLLKQIISTVTAEDLRFTGEEIAGLYRLLDITLPEEEISAILRDTEGWPISVALLGRELERLDPAERSYLHPRIMERSLERMENDAYESMAPELRKFLLKLSLIQDWAPKLLEALTPDRKLISALEQAAPFIRYDGYRDRYRIHHLFIEFLQEKESELTEDEKLEVYNKAGDWCAENRLSMDAALNYGKGRNYRGLIGVTSSLPRMAPAQTAEFLLNIIDQTIPPGSPVPETEEALLLRYVERSKFLISLRRFSEAADTCREAIELFAGRAGDPLAGIILTAAYNNLGDIAFYNCTTTRNYDFSDYEKAASYFSTASEWSPACQCVIRGYICPVGSPAEEGEFEKAIAAIGAFIPYTVCSLNGGYYGLDSLAKTEYAWFRGDLAQVETYARQAVYQAREKNQWEIEAWALFFLLRINLYAGNRAELRELIKQLDALLAISEYFNRYAVNNVIMGWFYAQLGAAERVGPWLKNDYYELDFDDRSGASFQTLVKAKCCFAVKRYTATLHILNTPPEETARSPDRHAPFLLGRLEQNLLRAAALIRRSAEDTETSAAEALRCLEEAWRMAAPNGLDMPFIELGEEMRILAGRALRDKNCAIPRDWLEEIRGKASAYRKRLLKIYQGPEYSPKPREAPSLSWRETEVLRTLSLGWSREQIAEKMALSVNTVKAEIRSIYAKLGAVNRVDAVRIALELNIFSR